MFTGVGICLAFLPFVGGVSTAEMIILGVVAVLLFGNKLPDVMRSMGKSLVEFRKGMSGIENEIRAATAFDVNSPPPRRTTPSYRDDTYHDESDRNDPAVPKFEPPPASTEASADKSTSAVADAGPADDSSTGMPSVPRYEPSKYEPPAGEAQLS